MINAIYKEIGKEPILIQFERSLHNFRRIVGGSYKAMEIASDCAVIYQKNNDELSENCTILNKKFNGNILIVGMSNGKFTSVPDKAMELLFPIPKTPDELISVLRNTKSRSKRLLLDSAADMIEELKSQNEMLLREIEK